MACWHATIALGLVLGLAGCNDPAEYDLAEGSSTSGDGAVSTAGAATSVSAGGDGGSSTTYSEGNSSGSVEDTLFGMSDDMPLVCDIPDIKRGVIDPATWVAIEQVRPISGRASLGRGPWFYVQAIDPIAKEPFALRVVLSPADGLPPESRALYLEGYVAFDAQGWLLDLTSMVEGAALPPVSPRRVRLDTLLASDAAYLDDALVEVAQSGLVVARQGPVAGTVLVGAVPSDSVVLDGSSLPSRVDMVLVDLRPFDLVAPQPGTRLSLLRGVAEIGGTRPVILPRSIDDIVVAP